MPLIQYAAEMTDTFGGEANYSWRRIEYFDAADNATDSTLVRRAKRALNITGESARRTVYGDTIQLDMVGAAVRVFIFPAI